MPAKRLLVWSGISVLLFLGIGVIKTQAACYCVNAAASSCRCTASPPASATNPGTINGVDVLCDSPEEANSEDAVRAPICGSSPEVVPTCARGSGATGNENFWVCWGSSVATGTTTLTPPPAAKQQKTFAVDGQFYFNGNPFGNPGPKTVVLCADNLECCGNLSNCYAADLPATPTSCYPSDDTITQPQWCPNYGGGPTNPQAENAETDARIYFPHVKNTSAITYFLQSLFRPVAWTAENVIKNVIYSQVFEHQGISDSTPVINKYDNNSSLIPGTPAPSPLFDFGSNPPLGVPGDGRCVVTNVRSNPGDDLLGKKVYANMQYTQIYEYDKLPNCPHTGTRTTNSGDCCGGATAVGQNADGQTVYRCDPVYESLPSKGKALVYTKSPYLEYLYQNLVAGPTAIYRRFVSQDTAEKIEDIPTEADITVSSSAQKVVVGDGAASRTSKIYFPHLGSIYDYFLKDIQKLLRPKGSVDTFEVIVTDHPSSPGSISCAAPSLTSCGPVDWSRRIYDAYFNAYNTDNNASYSLVKEDWAQKMIDYSGMCPQFVAALWLEESGGSAIGSYDLGCIYNLDTKAKSQENTHPTNLSASELQQYREGILAEQIECLKSYVDNIGDDFQTFMCQYSGEADTDPSKPYRQCSEFTNNPNFPSNLCDLLGGYIPAGDSAPNPTNIDQTVNSTTTTGGGTPTQICATSPNGTYPLPANPTRCVVCQDSSVVTVETCRR